MKKYIWKHTFIATGILLTTAWLPACQDDEEMKAPGITYGTEVTIGNGFYPAEYSVTFDDARQLFIISLGKLIEKNQPATLSSQSSRGSEGGRN